MILRASSRRLAVALVAGVGAFLGLEAAIRRASAAPGRCPDSAAGRPSDDRIVPALPVPQGLATRVPGR